MTFAELVIEARKRARLRQEEVAGRAGVNRTVISYIERGGSSRWSTIVAVATVLGIEPLVEFLQQ